MRLLRVNIYPRKIVIYHATWSDIICRALCILGLHEYETVKEYKSVGAKEEMCLHCLKEKCSIDPAVFAHFKVSHHQK